MKKGIIVTSFGTTYKETRELCIESIENRIKDEFSKEEVTRAFTSRMVIARLKNRDNYHVDTPSEALERMVDLGIKDIYIQPLHIIEGHEYEKVLRESMDFLLKHNKSNIWVGKPLLSSEKDYERVVDALSLNDKPDGGALIFMGHGSDHKSNNAYARLENLIRSKGFNNVYIATVEGDRTIEEVIEELKDKNINKVTLRPLMLVAGDHAINDMASDDEDSWKSMLEKHNIKVSIELYGLGEVKEIQDIFIDHLKDLL